MERYFQYQDTIQYACYDRQDLIDEILQEDGWHEITKEQADALNPPMEEPSADEIAKQNRIAELENEMRELSYDFDQDKVGIYQPNLEEKKALYRKDYNELCQLKGVVPKKIK